MGRVKILLPRLGETMEEARVVDWLVAPGAAFRRGDVLLEVETDKTVVEVPALAGGLLVAHLVGPGTMVALGQPIAEIESAEIEGDKIEGDKIEDKDTPEGSLPAAAPQATKAPDPMPQTPAFNVDPGANTDLRPAASPAARAVARRAGVDLATLIGSGRRGRIQAHDVRGTLGNIAVHRSGVGLPIVLLHGLFDDHTGWRDLPRRLSAAGHEVLAIDLPGHGTSAVAKDFSEMVDRIADVLPRGQMRLVGHSLGAAIAVRLAQQLGARVDRVVLCAPAGLGARLNSDFTEGMLEAQTTAALGRALALLDTGPMSSAALTAELARLKACRAGHAAISDAVVRGGFQQIDITSDLASLECDIAVMFGTSDLVLDWRDVAHLPPHAAIHLIRGAGHLPHLAAPDLVFGLATRSFASQRRRADA